MRRLLVVTFIVASSTACTGTRAHWFDTQRRGTNFMNEVETRERFEAAAAQNIRLVRLVPDKWHSAERDFLIGDADDFRGLVPADLAKLRATLDDAHAAGVKVVLGLLSLPGARWRQHNGDTSDFRLYRDERFQAQAVEVWRQLAAALKEHPALVAFNPINEPHPERARDTAEFDLSAFYARVVAAIRESDANIDVVLDADDFAAPEALARLTPLPDAHVLYAFHLYEPWPYINHENKGRYRYPGDIAVEDGSAALRRWDKQALERAVQPVVDWQRRHAISSHRIFAAEFGCPRTHPGVELWLGDLISIFNARGWHWAFYSFREDTWHAMNYELGATPPPDTYWSERDAGKNPQLERRDNAIWRVITQQFVRH